MAARIKSEMSVGLTPEIESALKVATEFVGMKPSQFGRQAILEKLCREGYLPAPGYELSKLRRQNKFRGCRINAPQNKIPTGIQGRRQS